MNGFQVGGLVWAKMKGYSAWPGEIILPPAHAKPKKSHHYVYFFGSESHAWIHENNIQLHSKELVEKYRNNKSRQYQRAVATIIERSKGTSKHQKFKESSDSESVSNTESENKNFSSNSSTCDNSDQSDHDDSYSVSDFLNNSSRFDYNKTNFMLNIPPNFSYNADRVFSATPLMDQIRRNDRPSDFLNNLPNFSCNADGVFSATPLMDHRPDTPPIDLSYESEFLKKKKIRATNKKIGFLGLGKIGQGVLKNLCHSGHSVIIWNETPQECQDFAEKFNIQIAETPADVIMSADITLSSVSDINLAKQIVYRNSFIFKNVENGKKKCFIQLASMDPEGSKAIAHDITMNEGRYLEAPLIGSRIDANEGTLTVLASGEKSLYDDCNTCFDAISERQLFISTDVGTAFKFSLIHNTLLGTMYASVAEALALVKVFGLNGETFLDILNHGVTKNQINIYEKGMAMLKNNSICDTYLKQMQQDISLCLSFSNELSQSTPIIAAANEVYKNCKSKGYGEHDVSAVFKYYYIPPPPKIFLTQF